MAGKFCKGTVVESTRTKALSPGKERRFRNSVACNEDLKTLFKISKQEVGEEGYVVLPGLLGASTQLANLQTRGVKADQ